VPFAVHEGSSPRSGEVREAMSYAGEFAQVGVARRNTAWSSFR